MSEVTVTDADRLAAKAIVSGYHSNIYLSDVEGDVEDAIALALATAREEGRPPKGCVMLDTGEVITYIGQLIRTSDNVLVGHGAKVWVVAYQGTPQPFTVRLNNDDESNVNAVVAWGGPDHGAEYITDCYSTREAALAAKEAVK